jgi:hypothetical protein
LVEWANSPKRAPDAGQDKTQMAGAADTALQKQLASLTSQIEQKNIQIAELEKWAQELEATLSNKNNSGLARNIRHFLGKIKGARSKEQE